MRNTHFMVGLLRVIADPQVKLADVLGGTPYANASSRDLDHAIVRHKELLLEVGHIRRPYADVEMVSLGGYDFLNALNRVGEAGVEAFHQSVARGVYPTVTPHRRWSQVSWNGRVRSQRERDLARS